MRNIMNASQTASNPQEGKDTSRSSNKVNFNVRNHYALVHCLENVAPPTDGPSVPEFVDAIMAHVGDMKATSITLRHGCTLPTVYIKDVINPSRAVWSAETYTADNYRRLLNNALWMDLHDQHQLAPRGVNEENPENPSATPTNPRADSTSSASSDQGGTEESKEIHGDEVSDQEEADPNARTMPVTSVSAMDDNMQKTSRQEDDRAPMDSVASRAFRSIQNYCTVLELDAISPCASEIVKGLVDTINVIYCAKTTWEYNDLPSMYDQLTREYKQVIVSEILDTAATIASDNIRELLRNHQSAATDHSAKAAIYTSDLRKDGARMVLDPVIVANDIKDFTELVFAHASAVLMCVEDQPPSMKDVSFRDRNKEFADMPPFCATWKITDKGGDLIGKLRYVVTGNTPYTDINERERDLDTFDVLPSETILQAWNRFMIYQRDLISLEMRFYHKSSAHMRYTSDPSYLVTAFSRIVSHAIEANGHLIPATDAHKMRSTLAAMAGEIRELRHSVAPQGDEPLATFNQMGRRFAMSLDMDYNVVAESTQIPAAAEETRESRAERRALKKLAAREEAKSARRRKTYAKATANQISTAICMYCGRGHPGGIAACSRKAWDRSHSQPGQHATAEYRQYNRSKGRNFLDPSASTVPFPDHLPDFRDPTTPFPTATSAVKPGTKKQGTAQDTHALLARIMVLEKELNRKRNVNFADSDSDSDGVPDLASATSSEDTDE